MFSYYGSKSKLVKLYPKPAYDTLIEPFAGSAQYSFYHWQKNVILIEKYKKIYDVWNWLINEATPEYIMLLPLFEQGELIQHKNPFARDLIQFESNGGSAGDAKSAGRFNRWANNEGAGRKRIAENLHKIKHWSITYGDYSLAPNEDATWFIDSPYNTCVRRFYKHDYDKIDYHKLSTWCKSRRGQVIVCEDLGADWLPFRFLALGCGQRLKSRVHDIPVEAIWTNDEDTPQT